MTPVPPCVGIKRYPEADVGLLRTFSADAARREAPLFAGVKTVVVFIGYPRSGHSLFGSLLDAHPQAAVAHELDLFHFVDRGFSREEILSLVLENGRQFEAMDRKWMDYSYAVPGAGQGATGDLRVMGDKKGARSVRRLSAEPTLLARAAALFGAPPRLVHVARNPYDILATRHRRSGAPMEKLIDVTSGLVRGVARIRDAAGVWDDAFRRGSVLDVRHEDVIADPRREVRRLCSFVGLDAPPPFLDACAAVIFPSPRRSRDTFPFTPDHRRRIDALIASEPFLAGYSFEG